jgi:hypothetical protein
VCTVPMAEPVCSNDDDRARGPMAEPCVPMAEPVCTNDRARVPMAEPVWCGLW